MPKVNAAAVLEAYVYDKLAESLCGIMAAPVTETV